MRVDDGALPARRRRESDERVRSRGRVEFTDPIGPPFQVIERLKLNMTSSTRTGTYSEDQHSMADPRDCLRFILIRSTAVTDRLRDGPHRIFIIDMTHHAAQQLFHSA